MFILGMHPCIYEETCQRQLSEHLKAFLFLGFWQFIDQFLEPPNFPHIFGQFSVHNDLNNIISLDKIYLVLLNGIHYLSSVNLYW